MTGKKLIAMITGVCLILILAVLPFMGGCAPEEEEPTPPPPAQPIRLLFAHWGAPGTAATTAAELFKTELEELRAKGGSNVELEISYGGALGKSTEHYDLALEGIADITDFCTTWTPGRFPICDGLTLARCPGERGEAAAEAFAKFVEAGYLDEELENVKTFSVFLADPVQFYMREPVSSLADLEGKKIRSPGGKVASALAKELGFIGVSMPLPEAYIAIEKGVVDGTFTCYGAGQEMKLHEVAPYILEVNMQAPPILTVMNKETWKSLPTDAKDVINEGFVDWSKAAGRRNQEQVFLAVELIGEVGGEIVKPSPAEMAQLDEIMAPLYDDWMADLNSMGLDAEKIYKGMKSAFEDAGLGAYWGRK